MSAVSTIATYHNKALLTFAKGDMIFVIGLKADMYDGAYVTPNKLKRTFIFSTIFEFRKMLEK